MASSPADPTRAARELFDIPITDRDDRPLSQLLAAIARNAVRTPHFSAAVLRTLPSELSEEHVVSDGDPATVPRLLQAATSPGAAFDGIGVPITVRGAPVGGLYLAGAPGDRFGDAAMRAAESLAAVAGENVERARTAEANLRRERWHTAAALLAKEIAAGLHPDPLDEIGRRVLELAAADAATIIQHGAAEDTFVIAAAAGSFAEDMRGMVFIAADSLIANVMVTGRAARIADMQAVPLPDNLRDFVRYRHAVLVPLTGSGMQRGVLTIGRGLDGPQFTESEIGMATIFASTTALALELAESQRRRDQLALVEERDRIARDLHDHVIQRLYAIGLSIQNVTSKLTGDAEARLSTSVDELDETIKQIRTTIYQLTKPLAASEVALRGRAESLVADLTPVLGFAPRFTAHGALEFGVDEDVADDCIAVLREALSNIARHAQATEAEVAISVSPATVRVEVRDDGRGLGEASRRSGLANLRARAERRGGFMQVRSSPGDGTWLLWSVPIEPAMSGVARHR